MNKKTILLLSTILISLLIPTIIYESKSSRKVNNIVDVNNTENNFCLNYLKLYFIKNNFNEYILNKSSFLKTLKCIRPLDLFNTIQNRFHKFAFNYISRVLENTKAAKPIPVIIGNNGLEVMQTAVNDSFGRSISSYALFYNSTIYINVSRKVKYKEINMSIHGLNTLLGFNNSRWFLVMNATINASIPLMGSLRQSNIAEVYIINGSVKYNLCYPNISYIGEIFLQSNLSSGEGIAAVILYKVYTDKGLVASSYFAYYLRGGLVAYAPLNMMLASDCITYFRSKYYVNLTRFEDARWLRFDIAVLLNKIPRKGYIVAGLGLPGVAIYYDTEPLRLTQGSINVSIHYPAAVLTLFLR